MTNRTARILLSIVTGVSALTFSTCSLQNPSHDDSAVPEVFRFSGGYTVGQGQDAAGAPNQSRISPRMAITHSFTLRLPSADIEMVQRRHLDECAKLNCTVITTRTTRVDSGRVVASSSIRVSPEGFADFAKALASPPAQVTGHSQIADDKTMPLLDVEKRLEGKTALRDRLSAMLKDPGTTTTADLLAIEKELTQVQGDIEAATAQRDYLRTMTDTVRVDISYQGTATLTAGIDFFPISRAAREFGQTVASSVAVLITFLATVLPWIPLVALLAWGVLRAFRRRRSAAA